MKVLLPLLGVSQALVVPRSAARYRRVVKTEAQVEEVMLEASSAVNNLATASATQLAGSMDAIIAALKMESAGMSAATGAAAMTAAQELVGASEEVEKALALVTAQATSSISETSDLLQKLSFDASVASQTSMQQWAAARAASGAQFEANVASASRALDGFEKAFQRLSSEAAPQVQSFLMKAQVRVLAFTEEASKFLNEVARQYSMTAEIAWKPAAAEASANFVENSQNIAKYFSTAIEDLRIATQLTAESFAQVSADLVRQLPASFDLPVVDETSLSLGLAAAVLAAAAGNKATPTYAPTKKVAPIVGKQSYVPTSKSYIATKGAQFLASQAAEKKAFTAFCLQYGKQYKTHADWGTHFARWKSNFDRITEFNNNLPPGQPKLVLNQFADLA